MIRTIVVREADENKSSSGFVFTCNFTWVEVNDASESAQSVYAAGRILAEILLVWGSPTKSCGWYKGHNHIGVAKSVINEMEAKVAMRKHVLSLTSQMTYVGLGDVLLGVCGYSQLYLLGIKPRTCSLGVNPFFAIGKNMGRRGVAIGTDTAENR